MFLIIKVLIKTQAGLQREDQRAGRGQGHLRAQTRHARRSGRVILVQISDFHRDTFTHFSTFGGKKSALFSKIHLSLNDTETETGHQRNLHTAKRDGRGNRGYGDSVTESKIEKK